MPYSIATNAAGETVVSLNGVPAYVVAQEPKGEAFVLLGCRYGEPRPTIMARNKERDFLVDIAAQNLRSDGHLPMVSGGVLVWLDRGEHGVYQSGLGYICCRSSGRVLSCTSLSGLKLRIEEQRQAKLSERMDAGDASFHPDAKVLFIPGEV